MNRKIMRSLKGSQGGSQFFNDKIRAIDESARKTLDAIHEKEVRRQSVMSPEFTARMQRHQDVQGGQGKERRRNISLQNNTMPSWAAKHGKTFGYWAGNKLERSFE